MLIELWKPIPGFEGFYEASNKGRIRSIERWIKRKDGYVNHIMPRLMKLSGCKAHGYLVVTLHKDGKNITHLVHRLVAMAFIPNPENLPQVNHKDENKHNNCVENLEWCTNLYNSNYGTAKERHSAAMKNRPDMSKPVSQYTKEGVFIASFQSTVEAFRQTGISYGSISACCRNQRYYHTAGGFIWRYD